MIGGLARGLHPIVATLATTRNGGVVHVRNDGPVRGDMTIRALAIGCYVVWRLRRGAQQTILSVAAAAS